MHETITKIILQGTKSRALSVLMFSFTTSMVIFFPCYVPGNTLLGRHSTILTTIYLLLQPNWCRQQFKPSQHYFDHNLPAIAA